MNWRDIIKGLLAFLFGQRQAGRQEQQNADMAAVQKNVEVAREVERTVDAVGEPELDELRSRWTAKRPAGDQ